MSQPRDAKSQRRFNAESAEAPRDALKNVCFSAGCVSGLCGLRVDSAPAGRTARNRRSVCVEKQAFGYSRSPETHLVSTAGLQPYFSIIAVLANAHNEIVRVNRRDSRARGQPKAVHSGNQRTQHVTRW